MTTVVTDAGMEFIRESLRKGTHMEDQTFKNFPKDLVNELVNTIPTEFHKPVEDAAKAKLDEAVAAGKLMTLNAEEVAVLEAYRLWRQDVDVVPTRPVRHFFEYCLFA